MAAPLLASTHAELLRLLATNTGMHFQGLSQAARCQHLGLTTRLRRHLTNLDVAHNLARHITVVSAQRLLDEVHAATSPDLPPHGTCHAPPPGPPGTFVLPEARVDGNQVPWETHTIFSESHHSHQGFRFPPGSASDFQPGPCHVADQTRQSSHG